MITNFVSAFNIGEPVTVFGILKGHIRTVTFTTGKVRYSIFLLIEETTIHNVDSAFVEARRGESMQFDFDNYS